MAFIVATNVKFGANTISFSFTPINRSEISNPAVPFIHATANFEPV